MKIVNVKRKSLKPKINRVFKKYQAMSADLKARFHKLYPDSASRKPLYVYNSEEKKVKVLPMNVKGVLYYILYPLIVLKKKVKIVIQKRIAVVRERRTLRMGQRDLPS